MVVRPCRRGQVRDARIPFAYAQGSLQHECAELPGFQDGQDAGANAGRTVACEQVGPSLQGELPAQDGQFVCSAFLFNHESPRRGLEFVTRKVVNAVTKIKRGLAKEVRLGNLNAKRDWGYAGDYVKAMWLMLQQETPEDYVIATGETHAVQELVEMAFGHVQDYVIIDERFYRPAEVHELRGNASKARRQLGWTPTIAFRDLVHMMVDAEMVSVAAHL